MINWVWVRTYPLLIGWHPASFRPLALWYDHDHHKISQNYNHRIHFLCESPLFTMEGQIPVTFYLNLIQNRTYHWKTRARCLIVGLEKCKISRTYHNNIRHFKLSAQPPTIHSMVYSSQTTHKIRDNSVYNSMYNLLQACMVRWQPLHGHAARKRSQLSNIL